MSVMSVIHIRNLFVITLIAQQGVSQMTFILLPTAAHVHSSIHPFLATHHRKSCLKPSRYSFSATATLSADTTLLPILVVDKPKCCKQITNVFVDDREFPDKSEYYDSLVHNIDEDQSFAN
jgi:hypothetical protein